MKRLLLTTLLAVSILVCAPRSEAATKITFLNKADRDVYVALYIDKATNGWYSLVPGGTWIYESRENIWDVGYYAEGHAEGKKTLYWEGSESFIKGWVHPTESFNIRGEALELGGKVPDGSKQVGFRHISLMRETDKDDKDTNFVATVTLVENPQFGKPKATE